MKGYPSGAGRRKSAGAAERWACRTGAQMEAMVLETPAPVERRPLRWTERPDPTPGPGEVVVRVEVCGVCRTDLHLVEGDLPPLRSSIIPGHEVVGRVESIGTGVDGLAVGDRIGVPWLHGTCGRCEYCRTGRENLCESKTFTGYSVDGGYATRTIAAEAYAFRLPSESDPAHLAPLLCAGIIGYRALRMALPRPGGRIGFFGFGGSAHLALQLATHLGYETVVYSGSPQHAALARELGATEVVLGDGDGTGSAQAHVDGAVVFAPAGAVVLRALAAVRK
ncbi:Zinc-containing alcohol dehydrogenase, partial [mine drainage metagenome]